MSIYIDMKVKYFTPDIFELDNLMSDPPIIRAGPIVQAYMPVDRTGHFNPFHMSYNPIPKFKILISLGKSVVWKQQETYGNWENL